MMFGYLTKSFPENFALLLTLPEPGGTVTHKIIEIETSSETF